MFSIGTYAIKKAENLSLLDNNLDLENKILPKPSILVSPRTKISFNSPLKLSTTESAVTTTTKSPSISMVNATDPLAPTTTTTTVQNEKLVNEKSVNGNRQRLKCVDRAFGYPILKNIYFLFRGIYLSLAESFPKLMKPVTFMEDSIHKLLGEQGIYVLDMIVNKWLDFVEPMMKFFLLPWIKTGECITEMAMIPLSPVIERLLKSLGYEYLQTNGHHHQHQHSHAPPIRPPSTLPVIEQQHIDKPEIPRKPCKIFTERQFSIDGKIVKLTDFSVEELGR